jgi:hypothetical protein
MNSNAIIVWRVHRFIDSDCQISTIGQDKRIPDHFSGTHFDLQSCTRAARERTKC